MYTKDLKNTKGIALIYLIMIILSILIISAVAIVGVTKKVKKGGTNQEISQETSESEENQNTENSSNTSKGTKVTAEQIAKNPEKYYGQEVKNYTKGDRVYRIFYVDTDGYFGEKNTIYLKADWTADIADWQNKGTDKYIPKTTKVLEKMNQEWAKERLNATWGEVEHFVAWLCDPATENKSSNQEWAPYYDMDKANYVIGGPSVEMYAKSYNQVPHLMGNYKLGTIYIGMYKHGYIYTLNGTQSTISNRDDYTGNDTLDYLGYNSMYCGKNDITRYCGVCLASPSASTDKICYIFDGLTDTLYETHNGAISFSPLVSLKSDFTPEI